MKIICAFCFISLLFVAIPAQAMIDIEGPSGGGGKYVATIEIYSSSTTNPSFGSISTSGHSFIAIKNISSITIKVGKMDIQPSSIVTLSTWGNRGYNGIWYNLESYLLHQNSSAYSDAFSIGDNVSAEELSKINNYINQNDSWSLLENCSYFSVNVWNLASDQALSTGSPCTPTNLKNRISKIYNYSTGVSIPYNTMVGYYNSNGFVSYIH